MKNLKFSLFAMIMATLLFSACAKETLCIRGTGSIITETLDIPDFNAVEFQEAGNVIISQGPVQEVKVTGNANIINKIEKEVYQGLWVIDLGRSCYRYNELTFEITMPYLTEATLSGIGEMTINDFSNQGDLSLLLSGAGYIDLHAFEGIENLKVKISGSGTIEGNSSIGPIEHLDLKISGSGDYKGFSIESERCDVHISGSGKSKISVLDELDVRITGSGKVYYRGYPSIDQTITGSGKVVNAN